MYAKLKSALKSVTIKQAIIGLIVFIFLVSGVVGYFGSQYMYYDIMHQKMIRDKADKL